MKKRTEEEKIMVIKGRQGAVVILFQTNNVRLGGGRVGDCSFGKKSAFLDSRSITINSNEHRSFENKCRELVTALNPKSL